MPDALTNSLPPAALSALSTADPILVERYRRFSVVAAFAVMAIGMAGIVGWHAELALLTHYGDRWPTMKVNTALGLVFAGAALVLCASGHSKLRHWARPAAFAIVLLGVATLAEWLSGRDFGIDQLLVVDPTPGHGRMAFITTVNFVVCGLALMVLARPLQGYSWLPSALTLPAFAIAMTAGVGYLLGARELYTPAGTVTAISIPAALSFSLLGAGIVASRVDESVVPWLASPNSGGFLLRRLGPLALVVPVVVVWLRLRGQEMGLFSSIEFGAATVAVVLIAVFWIALLWCAAVLDRLDVRRLAGEREIVNLNGELMENLRNLEVANRELEELSYAMSHVMRAPLRAINGFARVLEEEYMTKLDDEARRLLGVIRRNADQMAGMIDGTTTYLRLRQKPLAVTSVDMNKLVQSATKAQQPKLGLRKVKIAVQPLPTIDGDEEMLRQVWVQLLDNALKFTASRVGAVIEVGFSQGEGETTFFVRDNGIGFDMQFGKKLFGVFNRLHGDEVSGHGMGLAIVRRIVTRHGGRVWAEGRPGEGATLYFALPTKERRHA